MKNNPIYYSVGALLYCPANHTSVADSVIEEAFEAPYSLALCLEDTIADAFVEEAERILVRSLKKIYEATKSQSFYLPKLFIRVRRPDQISRLLPLLGESIAVVTGFIAPKFGTDNAKDYVRELLHANENTAHPLYLMPILESADLIDLRKRTDFLYTLKDMISPVEEQILNIRVGGNDLCHLFGFRRHADESIHQIRPITDIFSDIITVFGTDYVISGPVWEYYAGKNWRTGLLQELSDDYLCGFIGKTVIHPNQISVVNASLQVSEQDLADAKAVLNWDENQSSLVSGSENRERMNEYKTHFHWAQKILYLAEAYGVEAPEVTAPHTLKSTGKPGKRSAV